MITFLDMLCPLFLQLAHTLSICLLGVVFCFWDLKKGGSALFLLLFALLFNPFLKSIWQVPLLPSVGHEGWAFPSGHMQVTCTFYGWMAWQMRPLWFRLLIIFLLGGLGISLIYCGFHTLVDVLGAVFFAGLTILIYHKTLTYHWVKERLPWMGIFMTPLTLLFIVLYPAPLTFFMGLAQVGLIFLSLGWVIGERFFPLRKKGALLFP